MSDELVARRNGMVAIHQLDAVPRRGTEDAQVPAPLSWPVTIVRPSAFSVVLLLLGAALDANGQQLANAPRIGLLDASPGFESAFLDGLRQFGYVEGKNIALESRWANDRAERFPDLAAELVRLKIDVIVATNNPAVAAAQKATKTIPIVMVLVTDPVRLGFVTSLARPTGNITGLTIQAPDLAGKRLQILKEAVPRLTRVAILWDPTEPGRGLPRSGLVRCGERFRSGCAPQARGVPCR